ncbi:MAG: MFS transporter [Phycisphaerae bacterium]|nr:MFS transporter [Phycisphaerae bacterium]
MEKLVALLCVFGLGMCFSLLGSISVKLMPRLKIDQGKFGSLISAFMFSCLVASLIAGVVADKVGYKPVAIFGFIATAGCIFVFARGKTYGSVVLPCLLLGFGAMALNTAGNVMGPQVLFDGTNQAAASNLINVFFGLGLFLTPLLVSFLFQKTTYEKAVSALAVIVLVPAALAIFCTTYPVSQAGFVFGDAVALLAKPAVLVAALVLFCYISLESSFCNWLPAFGKEVISKAKPDVTADAADASGQRLLSLFAVAMMVGRLVASQIPAITEYGSWFIAGAAVVAAVVIMAMTVSKSTLQAQVLAILAGLFFAPCFPTTIGVTFAKFSPEVYGSVFGIVFAIGLAGAVIVPKAIGNLAKGSSIQKSLKLLIPACVLLIVLALVLGKI